jgi:hypothetical protein
VSSNHVIVYHDKCHDGITALWCARQRYPESEAYPGQYNVPPDLERLRGKDVIIVDFSWKRGPMLDVSKVAKSILVLDHHKSAEAELAPGDKFFALRPAAEIGTLARFEANLVQDDCENANVDGAVIYTVFDMERSGAGLAWDVLVGGPRPPLVDMVEDRDLWRFAIPASRAVHAALASYPLDEATRWLLMRIGWTEEGRKGLVTEGQAILRYHDERVREAVTYARPMRFDEFDVVVPSVCLPHLAFYSDIGATLAKNAPFAVCWYGHPTEPDAYLSLRSREGGFDVSKVAERFGGGGHAAAAGFPLPYDDVLARLRVVAAP